MTTLETYQRGLLELIKNRGVVDDPYLCEVARSREIAIVREIAIWWRLFQIEAQCPLVSGILKHYGCFQEVVTAYFNSNRTSPFAEELSHGFLDSLKKHTDGLLRSIAGLEDALLRARAGSAESHEILLDRNPDQVFLALETGNRIPPPEPGFTYASKLLAIFFV